MNKKGKDKINPKAIFDVLKTRTIRQFIKEKCGERIGFGQTRDVYVLKENQDYVIKVERDMSLGYFNNASEFRHYVQNKDWIEFSKWLAPCIAINQTGNILIQKRVTHGKRKDYPKYIPCFFTDLKVKNFGWIDGEFVCCDYAYIPFHIGKYKMKYAKWWGSIK